MKKFLLSVLLLMAMSFNAWSYPKDVTFTTFPVEIDFTSSGYGSLNNYLFWADGSANLFRSPESVADNAQKTTGTWTNSTYSIKVLYPTTQWHSGNFYCVHTDDVTTANAWAVITAMPFEEGEWYQVTYKVKSDYGTTEKLEFTMSSGMNANGTAVASDLEITNTSEETRSVIFKSPVANGNLGLHCISNGGGIVSLSNIKVEHVDAPAVIKPNAVADFTAIADAAKPMTANLSWTCPTTGTGDEDLSDKKLTAKVSRKFGDGAPVLLTTLSNLTAGSEQSYSDVVSAEGDYTYIVSVGCLDSYSDDAEATCGLEKFRPVGVSDLAATADKLNVSLAWTNPSLYTNDKPIGEQPMTVELYRNNELLTSIENSVAGASASYDDVVPAPGDYTYYAIVKTQFCEVSEQSNVAALTDLSGSIALPYNAQETEFLDWTAVDIDGNGKTWNLAPTKLSYSIQTSVDGDDLLKTPMLRAGAGKYVVELQSGSITTPVSYTINCMAVDGSVLSQIASVDNYTAEEQSKVYYDLELTDNAEFYIAFDLKTNEDGGFFVIDNMIVKKAVEPKAATELTVTPDANKGNKATISWKNPTEGTEGETLGSMTALIYRNDALVAQKSVEPGTTTVYTDNVPEAGHYIYAVELMFDGTKGEKAVAEEATVGKIITTVVLPYEIDFKADKANEGNDVHTFINGTWNIQTTSVMSIGDGGYWAHEAANGAVAYHRTNAANTWINSPAIPVVEGKDYAITYTYKRMPSNYGEVLAERFELTRGTTKDEDDQIVIATNIVENDGFVTVTKKFRAEETGDLYFGLHYNTKEVPSSSFTGIAFADFKIEESQIVLPAEVADFTAVAKTDEEYVMHLAWTVPAVDADGAELSGDVDAMIYRGADLIKTFTVVPGSSQEYDDVLTAAGTYTYTLKVGQYGLFNDGATATGEVSTFIPNVATELVGNPESPELVKLSWMTPSTYTNGVAIADDVNIAIYRDDEFLDRVSATPGEVGSYSDESLFDGEGVFNYYVVVETANGVKSEKSNKISVSTIGTAVAEVSMSNNGYYSNGTNVYILNGKATHFEMYSVSGVKMIDLNNVEGTVDCSKVPNGIYVIVIDGKSKRVIK